MIGVSKGYMVAAHESAQRGLQVGLARKLANTIRPGRGVVDPPWKHQTTTAAVSCLRRIGSGLQPGEKAGIFGDCAAYFTLPRTIETGQAHHFIALNTSSLPVLINGLLKGKESVDAEIRHDGDPIPMVHNEALLRFVAVISATLASKKRDWEDRRIETHLFQVRRWAAAGEISMMEHLLQEARLEIALLGAVGEHKLVLDCYWLAAQGAIRSAWLYAGMGDWLETERALNNAETAARKVGIGIDGNQTARLRSREPLSPDEIQRVIADAQPYRALFPAGHRLALHQKPKVTALPV